jgi:uncharacterized membrane protein YkvA (DUF1232 family)
VAPLRRSIQIEHDGEGMNFISWRVIIRRIGAIRFLMRDKTVPLRKKLLVVFGIAYLIMPFDLIPVVVFYFAWIDDLILWLFILWNLKDYLDKYQYGEKTINIRKNFHGKAVVDDVKFTVDDGAGDGSGKDREDDPKDERKDDE